MLYQSKALFSLCISNSLELENLSEICFTLLNAPLITEALSGAGHAPVFRLLASGFLFLLGNSHSAAPLF